MSNRMPDVVRQAIEGRLQAEAQRERARRAELARGEVIAPMMQNIQVGREIVQPVNPLTNTLANNIQLGNEMWNPNVNRIVVNPIPEDIPLSKSTIPISIARRL